MKKNDTIREINTKDKTNNFILPNLPNTDQQYINDLKYTFRINNSVPTHTPKKFVDCFWVRDNSGTKELYIYVGGSWEQII